jgi:poly(3-hydroxybutyrate) depolymerase
MSSTKLQYAAYPMNRRITLLIICLAAVAMSAIAQEATKEKILSGDKERTYYLFIPEKLEKEKPVPMVILLHGSGHNGLSFIDRWKELAAKERFIIVGPDSLNSKDWQIPVDGPDFICDLVEDLKTKYPIDGRRVYLFGHSGGAIQALHLSLYESQYFAATVAHAGVIDPRMMPFIERARRKIPIAIFVGTKDRLFPVKDVRSTRDALNASGFNAQLTEIKGHTHDYYSKADEINKAAWKFLKTISLASDPSYQRYAFPK